MMQKQGNVLNRYGREAEPMTFSKVVPGDDQPSSEQQIKYPILNKEISLVRGNLVFEPSYNHHYSHSKKNLEIA
jgi:hypothetical protein